MNINRELFLIKNCFYLEANYNSHDTNYLVSRAIARIMADAMANSTYLIHVQLKFTAIYVS